MFLVLLSANELGYQKYVHNEDQSGGAGADEGSDGEIDDSNHSFNFMEGRLATLIWSDGCNIMGLQSGNNFTGQIINPDNSAGSGSSGWYKSARKIVSKSRIT